MPDIPATPNHFQVNWNADLRDRLYGPKRKSDLDGEYIDSSEGYVTDELDFARSHFAAAPTPLTFSATSHRPAVFRGLIAQAYVQRIAADIHAMDHLMMANSTPNRLCWLMPLLDVIGTGTNWNRNGKWQPMSDSDLLYRRALCKGKPYCFLMNTQFDLFSHALVEKYMQRGRKDNPSLVSVAFPRIDERDAGVDKVPSVARCQRAAAGGDDPSDLHVAYFDGSPLLTKLGRQRG